MDNWVAKFTLEKSWVHNFIKSKISEKNIYWGTNKSETFLLTVLNVSYCACEEPFIVLSITVLWSNRHLIESNMS